MVQLKQQSLRTKRALPLGILRRGLTRLRFILRLLSLLVQTLRRLLSLVLAAAGSDPTAASPAAANSTCSTKAAAGSNPTAAKAAANSTCSAKAAAGSCRSTETAAGGGAEAAAERGAKVAAGYHAAGYQGAESKRDRSACVARAAEDGIH